MNRDAPCANCGTPLVGEWCHACGQKRFRPEERSLRHLAGEFLSAVTEVDGRLLATLKGLLFGPGRMIAAYLSGARRRYLSPITVFLLANLVYFIAPPLSDFALSLGDHLTLQPYSEAARALVEDRLASRNISLDEYRAVFEARQDHLARSLIILHVPLIAIGLSLLHLGRRRPAADHVVVATCLMTYVMVGTLTVPYLIGVTLAPLGLESGTFEAAWRLGLVAVIGGYFAAVLRGAYGQPAWLAVAKTPLALAVLIGSSMIYRGLMFGIVFALS